MPLSTKIIIAVAGVLLLGALGFIIYQQHQIATQQTQIQSQIVAQQQLVDGIMRSQSQYATKEDIVNFAKQNDINLKAIQDNLDKLGAQVASINVITANSNGQNGNNIPTTNTGPINPNPPTPVTCKDGTPCPDPDPFGYMKTQQNLVLNEDFTTTKIPIGNVGFSAWQKNPWDIHINPRTYHVDTVVGTDENQRQYFYNKFTVQTNGQTYTVPITTATTKQEVPTAKFSFWNPRLLVGLDGGVGLNPVQGEFIPSLNLGIMSYGQYKTTPDFSVLEVGVGYGAISKRPQLVVTPVAYNIGKNVFSPLMNNTYLAPSISVGTDGNVTVGAGLRVGF